MEKSRLLHKIFLVIIILINTISFAQKNTYYSVKLTEIKPSVISFEAKEDKNENGTRNIVYTDSLMRISFSFEPTHIDFIMENKAKETIKIIWDNAIYIGSDGFSKGIFHSGVKLNDIENHQAPTSIFSGSKISDLIIPKGNVNYSDYFHRWVYNYMFFEQDSFKIKIILPLEINEKIIDYVFYFDVQKTKAKIKTRFISDRVYYKNVETL